jgi:hypothetical protein
LRDLAECICPSKIAKNQDKIRGQYSKRYCSAVRGVLLSPVGMSGKTPRTAGRRNFQPTSDPKTGGGRTGGAPAKTPRTAGRRNSQPTSDPKTGGGRTGGAPANTPRTAGRRNSKPTSDQNTGGAYGGHPMLSQQCTPYGRSPYSPTISTARPNCPLHRGKILSRAACHRTAKISYSTGRQANPSNRVRKTRGPLTKQRRWRERGRSLPGAGI